MATSMGYLVTKSRNGCCWKEPLKIVLSLPTSAHSGPTTASCLRPCPGGFLISLKMETPQPFWGTHLSSLSLAAKLPEETGLPEGGHIPTVSWCLQTYTGCRLIILNEVSKQQKLPPTKGKGN